MNKVAFVTLTLALLVSAVVQDESLMNSLEQENSEKSITFAFELVRHGARSPEVPDYD